MDITEHIAIHAAPHPVPQVQRAGFPLDHPYMDHSSAPVLGPTGTLMVRRLPWLWKEAAPVEMPLAELSRSLGLGGNTSRNSPVCRTIERLIGFRFASRRGPGELDVYVAVPPLSPRQLDKLPAASRRLHEQLLSPPHRRAGRLGGAERPGRAEPGGSGLATPGSAAAARPLHGPVPMTPRQSIPQPESHFSQPSRCSRRPVPATSRQPASNVVEATSRRLEPPHPAGHTLAGFPPGNLLAAPAR